MGLGPKETFNTTLLICLFRRILKSRHADFFLERVADCKYEEDNCAFVFLYYGRNRTIKSSCAVTNIIFSIQNSLKFRRL